MASYTIDINDVPISATGKYPQGELTRETLEELASSYNPTIHKARVRIGHASEYQSRNIPEAPVFAYVEKLKVVDKGNRSFLLADFKAHEAFTKYNPLYPEYSIEIYDKDNPNNPTVQPHVNNPQLYLKGVAMLGATPPAVKGLDSVVVEATYSEYRFNTREFLDNLNSNTQMDTIKRLKEMLNASDELDVVKKVETMLAKSLDYEKMYSEAKATKNDLENKVAALEKQFAEAQKQLARKEFEAKLTAYDEKVRAKALEAFDAQGKEFANKLLDVIAVLPTQHKPIIAPQSDDKATSALAFKSYQEWIDATISYDDNKKRKANEFAKKHGDVIRKWVEAKSNN